MYPVDLLKVCIVSCDRGFSWWNVVVADGGGNC